MNVKKLCAEEPQEFIRLIKAKVGPRWRGWADPDITQVFWLGVMKGIQKVRPNDPLKYLVVRGYGAVRSYAMANYHQGLMKVCRVCGRTWHFRKGWCSCGGVLDIRNRFAGLGGLVQLSDIEVLDIKVDIDLFVETLPKGRFRYVARRWLQDRVDLLYVNHLQQLSLEMGISAQAVSRYKVRVRNSYRSWYGSNL